MTFLDFWKPNLTDQEIQAIRLLEQQVLSLNNEWSKYDKQNFIDWNTHFKGLAINQINPKMQIPMRDAVIEKKEFNEVWKKTEEIFNKAAKMIQKGKSHDAIIVLFNKLRKLEGMIGKLENEERRTLDYLKEHQGLFKEIFDNNYGEDYFSKHVIENYEVRFRILGILKNQYELIRYLLSDIV